MKKQGRSCSLLTRPNPPDASLSISAHAWRGSQTLIIASQEIREECRGTACRTRVSGPRTGRRVLSIPGHGAHRSNAPKPARSGHAGMRRRAPPAGAPAHGPRGGRQLPPHPGDLFSAAERARNPLPALFGRNPISSALQRYAPKRAGRGRGRFPRPRPLVRQSWPWLRS